MTMGFAEGIQRFVAHYKDRWPDAAIEKNEEDGFSRCVVSSPALLRDGVGNCPQILHRGPKKRGQSDRESSSDVIVLIHGLTDSPFYMQAIAQDFARLGFNVILPLLPAHGLKRPGRAFHTLRHTDWTDEVDAICEIASELGDRISIGGLSTGGALSVHKALRDPQQITGALFLYSAALDIGTVEQLVLQTEAGRMIARLRDQQVWLAKTVKEKIQMILDDQEAGKSNDFFGIGENRYKYSVLFFEGASQLAEVIQEINERYPNRGLRYGDLSQPVFVAHAKDDDQARFRGAQLLVDNHPNDAVELYALEGVDHASVVLKDAIIDDLTHEERSLANPFYGEMSQRMLAFAKRHYDILPPANDICR